MTYRTLTSLLAIAAATQPAWASDAASTDADLYDLGDVITVEGQYRPATVSSATKTPTLLVDVPQTISVVTEQLIEDQAFVEIADVLRFVPGVSIGQGEGHRDQVTIRGQNTTADFFVDGLRDDVQYFRPLYNLERVEVLKGANALAFGRGGGGGVINRVTKAPLIGEGFGSVDLGADSFGSALATVDVNASLGDGVAGRLNAFYEHLSNHRDVFEGDRYAVNPTLAFEPSERTRIVLSYEHVYDDRVVDRGVPSVDGEPLRGFDETFFGSEEQNLAELRAHVGRARIDHRLAEGWTADATVQVAGYDKLYQNVYPIGIDLEAGTVSLDGYRDETDRRNLIMQANLVGEFRTGNIGHTLLVGVEHADQDTDNARRDALFEASDDDQVTFAFTDPLVLPAFGFPTGVRDTSSTVRATSVYVQDQVDLGDRVKLVGGLRYDRFDIDVTDRTATARGGEGELSRLDEEVSPRLGVIYKPVPEASVYASYSRSFLPRSGDQFLSLTPSDAALDPEAFTNWEAGVKWDLREDLSLTGAVFRLERDSGTTVDPNDPESTILVSGLTEGVELSLAGRVTPRWAVNAGYSYLDAQEDGRVVASAEANRELAQVPSHMLSLWNRFEATDRLSLGLGLHHQGAQFATLANRTELPAYTRLDAAAYYEVSDRVLLQLNVENLTDEDYFPAAHNDDNITTGEPLNARLTLRTAF
jgi:catecholate siderophore receptor